MFAADLCKKYSLVFTFLLFSVFSSTNLPAVGLYSSSFNVPYGTLDGMGLALGGYPLDVAMNPANLSESDGTKIEIGGSLPYMHIRYQDIYLDTDPKVAYTNDEKINMPVILPHLGVSIPVNEKLSYGAAFYVLGGAGLDIEGIRRQTPTGQTLNDWAGTTLPVTGDLRQIKENISTRFFIFKLTNALAYDFGKFSVGAGIEINYAQHDTRYEYRDLSGNFRVPGKGFDYKSDPAFSPGGIFGITYRLTEKTRVAYSYQTTSHLPLNGRSKFNMDRPDQFYLESNVSYIFKLPERHNAGIAFITNDWKFVLDASYLKYASTNSTIKQILEYPLLETPLGNTNQMVGHLNAKDVIMAGGGTEYKPDKIAYRAGYSYSSLLIGEDASAPMLAGVLHQHIFFTGLGIDMGKYEINLGYNHLFERTLKGSDMSDWDISHSMYPVRSTDDLDWDHIRMPFYSHKTSFAVDVLLIGLVIKY